MRLTDELVDEGIARELVHALQAMRRDGGPRGHRPHPRHVGRQRARAGACWSATAPYVAGETLAVDLAQGEADGATRWPFEGAELALAIERAGG